ncbi:MAG: redoxin domain-containing protein [Comamonas sp.]|jgi:thiol:disulfide interchange protein|nr:redoxin domain-containing protein [Comamonas sp.]
MSVSHLAAIVLLPASLLMASAAPAQPLQVPGLLQQQGNRALSGEVLSAEQAFVLTPPAPSAIKAEGTRQLLQLHWRIEPGYYLYRDQLKLNDAQGQPLALNIPQGEILTDAFFGTVQVFHDELHVEAVLPEHPTQWPLQLQWQGCAHAGVCYPPQQQSIVAQQLGQSTSDDTPDADRTAEGQPSTSPTHWLHSLALPASVLIGPVALPTMALVLFLALFLSQWWARRLQLRLGQPVDALLMRSVLAGLLAARLAYVGQWWREYWQPGAHPASSALQIVDIRDGGWNLWAGLAATAAWILWQARGNAALRRATLQALAAGAFILIAAHALRNWVEADKPAIAAITLVTASAQTVDLRSYQGQPLVINLWATWCPPCRREMPVLAQAQKEHPNIRFLWINQGEDAAAVMRYLQTMALPLPQVLLDPKQRASAHWQQRGLPSTYFYDAQGLLRGMRMGELSRASLAEQLTRIAPVQPASR